MVATANRKLGGAGSSAVSASKQPIDAKQSGAVWLFINVLAR
jgi:hypothetical protein